ncbi:phosphoribosylanthranilate isomerase [Moraxella cuniculi]|uniref:N-(5'-phosphoribosyl)anthranilate isomerase n=1 Tax=Moraxella cuniculi TaxID=34061 RepID=A0A3S4RKH6_9GAMM|nr:phosphoribosylanthranilate isomerase [Moraxella cuniculi]VEG12797.1 N-(5'-phosphoribosyl)anthranilate isomerase [Moraxella cuniculi]
MIKIKFCGLTRRADVQAAVAAGADAIGLVFYPKSPRAVSVAQAAELVQAVPAFVSTVALVVNIDDEQLQHIFQALPLDLIQFHGDESPEQCQRQAALVGRRWIKALRINAALHDEQSIGAMIDELAAAGASAVLLDAYHADKFGGTGERFDWSIIPKQASLPIILAGGLTPENVSLAAQLAIYAVDVSGGIEADKGIKDADKMQRFVANLRHCQQFDGQA